MLNTVLKGQEITKENIGTRTDIIKEHLVYNRHHPVDQGSPRVGDNYSAWIFIIYLQRKLLYARVRETDKLLGLIKFYGNIVNCFWLVGVRAFFD